MLDSVHAFLDNFGITLNDAMDYQGEVPPFDALNRTIYMRTAGDVTEGVGETIAFMMQYHLAFKATVEMVLMT